MSFRFCGNRSRDISVAEKYFSFVWVERGVGYYGRPGNLAASFSRYENELEFSYKKRSSGIKQIH
jgi:hypothetical protein